MAHPLCMLDKQCYIHARACTRLRAWVPIRTRAHTHTHTHTHVILVLYHGNNNSPRTSMLHYTYIACLLFTFVLYWWWFFVIIQSGRAFLRCLYFNKGGYCLKTRTDSSKKFVYVTPHTRTHARTHTHARAHTHRVHLAIIYRLPVSAHKYY
jgi:hypothetical protein